MLLKKLLKHPLLGNQVDAAWNVRLRNEVHMSNDSQLFQLSEGKDRLPLVEGKHIGQFQMWVDPARYWIEERDGRRALYTPNDAVGGVLPCDRYRLAFRRIARNTDSRTLIACVVPPRVFVAESLNVAKVGDLGDKEMAAKLFEDIGPRYAERPGGYTRILKIGPRQGDNAPMARIELV